MFSRLASANPKTSIWRVTTASITIPKLPRRHLDLRLSLTRFLWMAACSVRPFSFVERAMQSILLGDPEAIIRRLPIMAFPAIIAAL